MNMLNERPDNWQTNTWERLNAVWEIIKALSDYWPLTLRQIFYQCVVAKILANNQVEYKSLSRLLSNARIDELIPWESMEDRSRTFLDSAGYYSPQCFIDAERANFLEGYRRDLLQSQEFRLEVWVEKDALAHIAYDVAFPRCVPVAPAKGFTSTSYLNNLCQRVENDGRPLRILYFGDFDPSGCRMPCSMSDKLYDRMGLNIDLQHVALLPAQIAEYSLPEDFKAMKPKDPNVKWFKAKYGNHVAPVELDALPPDVLQNLVVNSILAEIDLTSFEAERSQEAKDLPLIAKDRKQVLQFLERSRRARSQGLQFLDLSQKERGRLLRLANGG